jgi:hypothetical protein
MNQKALPGFIAATVCATGVGFFAAMCWRLFVVVENHWAYDHRWLRYLFLAELGMSALTSKQLTPGLGISLSLLLFACLVVLEGSLYFNGLVPYNLWIERGMPLKWHS